MQEILARLANLNLVFPSPESWSASELDRFFQAASLFMQIVDREEIFAAAVGPITIERKDIGSKLGLAYVNRIEFSAGQAVSPWSVVHELAHVWDAKNDWRFSAALEKYTHGFTSKKLSHFIRHFPWLWDAGPEGPEQRPGRYGRKPGVNAYGYFHRGKPSGANWNFNRREDFAESVVMYCGWSRDNELSDSARKRIERYLLPNGSKDPLHHTADNWSAYRRFFYPPNGDYTKTKRWQFVDTLLRNEIKFPPMETT